MSTKHSPGQWESDDYGTPEQLYGIRTQFVILSQDGPVAYVYTKEDARLIAAAPELLEALRVFADFPKDVFETEEDAPFTMTIRIRDLKIARAVIAAATGEQA